MKNIAIYDTTLRDGEQSPGCSMNPSEKLNMALQLRALGVDCIEAGFSASSDDDYNAVKSISEAIGDVTVSSLARAVKKDIELAAASLEKAAKPRIHIVLATSDIHLRYKLKMSREEVLERTAEAVSYARSLCPEVAFAAEDATRTDMDFLAKVLSAAVENGAKVLTVPDTVGFATPESYADLIRFLRKNVKNIDKAVISAHCHNDIGLAVANTLAAISAGAGQVDCTVNGIGERAGNASLEEIVTALRLHSEEYGASCNINSKQILKTSRLLTAITGIPVEPTKPIVGSNAFVHESGIHQHGVLENPATYEIIPPESVGIVKNSISLGKHSGKHAFADRLDELGYKLSDTELESAFTLFKQLSERKKEVSDRDIEALLSSEKSAVPPIYKLVNYVVNSGAAISSSAVVRLEKDGEFLERVSSGSGPVDAAFQAISKIVDKNFKLINYSIQSVTDGEDAQGEAVVKLLAGNGKSVTGRGLSTDIIESSIKAYLNAVNKALAVR